MLARSLPQLRCPRCAPRGKGELTLESKRDQTLASGAKDVVLGELRCGDCRGRYPILAGVAILVSDVRIYLLNHCKGIAEFVSEGEIPREFQREYREACAEIESMRNDGMNLDEDLESERVNSLYVLTHFLRASSSSAAESAWWKAAQGESSPLLSQLIEEHWDHGPMEQIATWIAEERRTRGRTLSIVELGSGVGGLAPRLAPHTSSYLGVDSSFMSTVIARSLVLGSPSRWAGPRIPGDFIDGPLSRAVRIERPSLGEAHVDFVVGDIEGIPTAHDAADAVIALNAIDMLEEPGDLARAQHRLLSAGGVAIQSSPYAWPQAVAQGLRERFKGTPHSASSPAAVEELYRRAQFEIAASRAHIPWLFFKHLRQIELYSVHALLARKSPVSRGRN